MTQTRLLDICRAGLQKFDAISSSVQFAICKVNPRQDNESAHHVITL